MPSLFKVPVYNTPSKVVQVEAGATAGAIFGKNLWNADGSLVTAAQFAGPGNEPPPSAVTIWSRTLLEIPRNVTEVEVLATAGLVVRQASSDWVTRSILPTIGRTTVSNGDGAGGDIVVDLAVVPNDDGGAIQLTEFDAYGRAIKRNAADTDDLSEGGTNFYFTTERAQDAAGAAIAAGTGDGVTLSYNDAGNAINATNTDKGSVAVAAHEAAADPHPQYTTHGEALYLVSLRF